MQKYMKKWQKSGSKRNAIISKPTEIFAQKFYTLIFKSISKLEKKNQNRVFRNDRKIIRQRALRLGRVGPGQFVTDFDYMVKKKHFLFHNPYKKNNSFWDIALFEGDLHEIWSEWQFFFADIHFQINRKQNQN